MQCSGGSLHTVANARHPFRSDMDWKAKAESWKLIGITPPPKKGERIGRFVGRVSFVRFHILVGPRYMSTCLRMGEVHADSVPLELM